MPPRDDPLQGFDFRVEIEGVEVAAFSEVSGLGSETDVVEYRTGDSANVPRKLPGMTHYSNVVLRRGITLDRSLWDWRQRVIAGRIDRRACAIVFLDAERQPVLRWIVHEAWPSKWEGPLLDAATSDVAIQTFELAHEGLELE